MAFETRTLAGRAIQPIGLGCMSLSQGYLPLPTEADAEALLHQAIDMGYDHFDTARLYGRGKNEDLLSKVLKTRRDEVYAVKHRKWVDNFYIFYNDCTFFCSDSTLSTVIH